MTATDKKRRRLAMAIGDSFAAIRRRMTRSEAWLSLSAPAIKVYIELRLRWRHKDNNNGRLYISLRECEDLLRLSRASAVRAFAELQDKGFILKTRQGEAGCLPNSGTLENGGTGYRRLATEWALTDEPHDGQPPSHAYERWRLPDRSAGGPQKGAPQRLGKQVEKQFHVSAGGPRTGPLVDPLSDYGSAGGPVEAGLSPDYGSAGGPPISTIYPSPEDAPADSPAPATESAPPAGDPPRASGVGGLVVGGGLESDSEQKRRTRQKSGERPETAAPAGRKPRRSRRGIPFPTRKGKPTLPVKVLELLHANDTCTRAEVVAAFRVGRGEAQRALKVLCERGQAERVRYGVYQAVKDQP